MPGAGQTWAAGTGIPGEEREGLGHWRLRAKPEGRGDQVEDPYVLGACFISLHPHHTLVKQEFPSHPTDEETDALGGQVNGPRLPPRGGVGFIFFFFFLTAC